MVGDLAGIGEAIEGELKLFDLPFFFPQALLWFALLTLSSAAPSRRTNPIAWDRDQLSR